LRAANWGHAANIEHKIERRLKIRQRLIAWKQA